MTGRGNTAPDAPGGGKLPRLIPLAQQWISRAQGLDNEALSLPDVPGRQIQIERDAARLRICASDLGSAHLADRAPEVTELLQRVRRAGSDALAAGTVLAWFGENGYDIATGEPRR